MSLSGIAEFQMLSLLRMAERGDLSSLITRKVRTKYQRTVEEISVPVYARLQVLNLIQIDIQEMAAEINAILKLTYYYGRLPQHLIEAMKTKMVVHLAGKENILLNNDDVKIEMEQDPEACTLEFTFRNNFGTLAIGDVFWSPYEKYYLLLTLELRKLTVEAVNESEPLTYIYFKFMEPKNASPVSFSDERAVGFYEISPSETRTEYTFRRIPHKTLSQLMNVSLPPVFKRKHNQQKKKKLLEENADKYLLLEDIQEIEDATVIKQKLASSQDTTINFNFMHVVVATFRRPVLNFCTIIIPMFLISILNLFTFFIDQGITEPDEPDYGNKINAIIATMVSYIALIYQIRKQLPDYDCVTFVEIVLFLQLLTTLLATEETFRLMLSKSNKSSIVTPQFIITCVITGGTAIALILHFFYFICLRLDGLRLQKDTLLESVLDRRNWQNKLCNYYHHQELSKHPQNYQIFDEERMSFVSDYLFTEAY